MGCELATQFVDADAMCTQCRRVFLAWFECEIVQVNRRKYRSENVHAMFYFVDA